MNQKTLTMLQKSIEHWERNAAEKPEDASTRAADCALCGVFNNSYTAENDCLGCPVYEKTGETFCEGSPYPRADTALRIWRRFPNSLREKEWREAARDELEFLKSLLP